ncbi:MAG: DUF4832 domain-containing protein [Ruminococcus sp.]|uniref:DUF4832 domain-containing protein n=1 Tax=Ruminococcus sp. TaxID=41978 RepID=UPI0025E324F6|nr:DUF4832 domain-containing protein [Ruminococcus sp.]MCR5599727.1 DUF4832 domain-containing protein [Ruminococcus sp.]
MFKRITSFVMSAAVMISALPMVAAVHAEQELVDSGINYKEVVETIPNPGAGYTKTVWAHCSPNKTEVYDPKGSIVLFFINIGQFSSGINGKQDYDLDETFFNAWKQTFANCRKNGCMIGVRFRYDETGIENPEPATFDKVLSHIKQIKESKLFEEYKDIIAFVESGFVGKWGEQHGGKYTTVEYKARLLDAMLDAVPAPIPVTVRTPDTFAKYAGVDRSELDDDKYYKKYEYSDDEVVEPIPYLPDFYRVGIYDDGYMGSDSDLGTYANREIETNWLHIFTENTYFGGEFSGELERAFKYDTYLPKNAIPEMYKNRLSYINSNIFEKYKEFTFGKECDIEGVNNSAYYGETVFKFIRDHIGYRFVLRKSEHSAKVEQGGELVTNFDVENTGFANPVFRPKAALILEKEGRFYEVDMPVDVHSWKSGEVAKNNINWHLPDGIGTGKWNIYMRLSAVDDRYYSSEYNKDLVLPKYGIRFANEGVWNEKFGANYLGTFEVTGSEKHSVNNQLYSVGGGLTAERNSLTMTFDDLPQVDGKKTDSREWQEKDLLTAKDGNSISVRADSNNLYVMAEMPDNAKAPVYNLEISNKGERYWLYYESGGFIYFNHDSYAGCECKWNGKVVEFKVPFEVMDLKAGEEVSSLKVFLQDSGNSWNDIGDLTAKNVKIPSDFMVYTSENELYMKKGDSEVLYVKCSLPDIKYQWYHDGEAIKGASNAVYTVKSEDDKAFGSYSVKITTAEGTEKTVTIANIMEADKELPVFSEIRGDANCDGGVDMSDVVLIMQSLANPDKYGANGTEKTHITVQGQLNGDVEGKNNGITGSDALRIQEYLLHKIETLEIA